jgi:hypothetical protein
MTDKDLVEARAAVRRTALSWAANTDDDRYLDELINEAERYLKAKKRQR